MNDIKVSIIIPVYNMEKYLLRCLESVMFQTLKEIEIICINDGSTDGSLQILLDCAKEDSRIIVIDKLNTGYGNSMNVGLERANGEYVGIVESDDFVRTEMFEKLYESAKCQSAEIVKSNYYNYFTTSTERTEYFESLKDCKYNQIIEPLQDYKVFFSSPSIWSAIYSRDFLNKYKIRFLNTPGASYQDTSFFFKTCFCAKKIYLLEDAFLYYWLDNENSSVNNPQKIFNVCDEINEIKQFIDSFNDCIKWDILFRFKFQVYMWNYFRLGVQYQYAFLVKVGLELCDDMHRGYFNKKMWSPEHTEIIQKLVSDVDLFYQSTSKYNIQHKLIQDGIILNAHINNNILKKIVKNHPQVIIYGAGKVGKNIAKYLVSTCGLDKKYIRFAVSDLDVVIKEIDKIPVYAIGDLIDSIKDSIVIVAVCKQLQFELLINLKRLGFENYCILESNQINEIYQWNEVSNLEDLND